MSIDVTQIKAGVKDLLNRARVNPCGDCLS